MTKQAEIDYVKNTGGLQRVWLNEKPFRGGTPTESARLLRDFAALVELLALPPDARVLDVGCGPGWTSAFFARMGYRVTGLDIASDMITLAARRAEREGVSAQTAFFVGDSEQFGLAPAFDAVVVYDTLHHTQDERAVLANCYGALKPGGKLILAEPGWIHERRAAAVTAELGVTERGLTPRQLKRTLRAVGFRLVRHYVQTRRPFMDSPVAALTQAFYDLAYYFVLARTHLQVWLLATK